MTDYVFYCGDDDFPKDNRDYVSLDTDKGKLIAIALETSGVPHTGTFTDKQMRFSYDADYTDTVDEIIGKVDSDEYGAILREIKEKKDDSSYLLLLPFVAQYLHLSEGALRNRPNELQVHLCQMFTRLWYCDTPTIQRELTRAFTANRQTEKDFEEAKEREIQHNNAPEKEEVQTGFISREVIRRQAEDIKRRQAVREKQTAEETERERKFGQ